MEIHEQTPKSEPGKIRSNLNGFKSRITGFTTVMTDEDRIHQDDFVREYVQDLDPIGVVELRLARNIALDNWRVLRLKTVEENEAPDPAPPAPTKVPARPDPPGNPPANRGRSSHRTGESRLSTTSEPDALKPVASFRTSVALRSVPVAVQKSGCWCRCWRDTSGWEPGRHWYDLRRRRNPPPNT